MSQIKITSSNFVQPAGQDLIPEAHLDQNDPIHDLRRLAGYPDLNVGKLQEYKGDDSVVTAGSNITQTAMEKIEHQNANNVKPGSPEWFQLWFSKPYLTGEKPW